MDTETNYVFILMAVIIILGLAATLGYYFARYAFKDEETDGQNEPTSLSEPSAPAAELFKKPQAPELVKDREPSAELEVLPAPEEAAPIEEKPADLKLALGATRQNFFGRLKSIFSGSPHISDDEREAIEEVLYTSDLGPRTVQRLMGSVDEALARPENGASSGLEGFRQVLRQEMLEIFSEVEEDPPTDQFESRMGTQFWMVVGVNGAGKTTTIGKMASQLAEGGKRVLVVAGDTFRAAADSQLKVWSQRARVEIFSPPNVKDPSAVIFDGCQMALAQNFDVVLVDTAGRLHTQANLMEELKKMKRVMQKVVPEGPHEVLLVLDANSGQNALVQAKAFHEALDVTGVILTKLDGTAKGGVALGLAAELHLPIHFIGVGEGVKDLRPFQAQDFVDSIL